MIFKSICMFVKDLNVEFGERYIEVKLYNHLLEKTGITNSGPIQKHIKSFGTFFSENHEAVETMNANKFKNGTVKYSEKVFVNVEKLLKDPETNAETKAVIWKHLLYIWNLIDPASQAKRILKETSDTSKESVFIENMLDKVAGVVNNQQLSQSENPMGVAMNLMSSGVFSEIISGLTTEMNSGQLDMTKMFSSVNTLITKLSPDGMVPPEVANMMNMVQPMLQALPTNPSTPSVLPTIVEEAEEESKKSK